MPPVAHRPTALAWQVFRGSDAVRLGLLTPHQLRSSAWVRLRHDVYADARLERDHGLACRGAALRMPPGVRIAGPSAAYLHGVEHAADFTDRVHVSAPYGSGLRSQPGLFVHTTRHAPAASGRTDGRRSDGAGPSPAGRGSILAGPGPSLAGPGSSSVGPGSSPASPGPSLASPGPSLASPGSSLVAGPAGPVHRADGPSCAAVAMPPRSNPALAAWESAVWLEPVRAVGIIDTLLAMGLTTRPALADLAEWRADRTGGRRARWVFGLTDPAAQSPPESHLRVRLVLAGLPRPVAQHPARLPSGLVLHPDLAWPEFRVAVEYDGRWHADPDQLHRDRRRLNQLVAAGWLVLHVTSRRFHHEFPALVREIRAALASRGWRRAR